MDQLICGYHSNSSTSHWFLTWNPMKVPVGLFLRAWDLTRPWCLSPGIQAQSPQFSTKDSTDHLKFSGTPQHSQSHCPALFSCLWWTQKSFWDPAPQWKPALPPFQAVACPHYRLSLLYCGDTGIMKECELLPF